MRRAEFKHAKAPDKSLITGSRYVLLKNPDKLSDSQQHRLDDLLAANQNLNAIYSLKEQLQNLWDNPHGFAGMTHPLDQWCALATPG